MNRHNQGLFSLLLLAASLLEPIHAQTILTPWGNIQGMRVEGEFVEFEAGLRVVRTDWSGFRGAVKYLQRPNYTRSGDTRTVISSFAGITFKKVLTDTGPGAALLTLEVTAENDLNASDVYFCLDLPGHEFGHAAVQMLDARPSPLKREEPPSAAETDPDAAEGRRIRIAGRHQALEVHLSEPMEIRMRRDRSNRATALNDPRLEQSFESPSPGESPDLQVYLKLLEGDAAKGKRARMEFRFTTTVQPDPAPAHVTLEPGKPGRSFDGIGGNFRLQFPDTDGAVIRYCLDGLPVRWGRVDLPWAEWHPDEEVDPVALARNGQLHQRVTEAMEMARLLARRDIPVIVSVWSVPRWARAVHQPAGLRGIALNPAKSEQIVGSLAQALNYLKESFGVEAAHFSLNEPETGVEVRQTPAEHVAFVREMGLRMMQEGLSTRMLLGDTAHGTTAALGFINPGLEDPSLRGYVGALAFHTWRGCTEADLRQWDNAARQLNVPLLITESGPDAHLHNYPGVRLEPWFQLQEIELYIRICAYAQPATIMPWQLTTDYSVLTGGGIYSEEGPLRPTQRYWNLKQLALTPPGAFALPISCDRRQVTSAAFGDLAKGHFVVHLVNTGGQRQTRLSGLPAAIRVLRYYLTDETHGMQESASVTVSTGTAEITLPPASFVTLLGFQESPIAP